MIALVTLLVSRDVDALLPLFGTAAQDHHKT
jgi:hypothetical protein